MELEAFKESEKNRIRKSVRGIKAETGLVGKLEPEVTVEASGGDETITLQQVWDQVKQMRQVSKDGEFQKKDYGEGGGLGRGSPWSGRADNNGGGSSGRGWGKNNGDRRYGNERIVYDMTQIRCFRCDQMGHFARNCPGLIQGVEKEKGTEDLNEKQLNL